MKYELSHRQQENKCVRSVVPSLGDNFLADDAYPTNHFTISNP